MAVDLRGGKRPALWLLLRGASVLFIAGLLALLVWRLIDKGRGSDLVAAVRTGETPRAPSFRLPVLWKHAETWPADLRPALGDGEIATSELRGRPVVINFWASWCIPCKREAPRLVAAARAHAGEVAFLGLNVQDFKSDARRFLRRYRTNYVSVRDGGASTYSHYGLTALPETYFLDANGRIVGHSAGEVSDDEVEAGIRLALKRSAR
jgi:cytochrome c biogenesis protein CcmG, thiol:disulfide interchange protein DsbE